MCVTTSRPFDTPLPIGLSIYLLGLPSNPKSICRTGPAWPQPTGPEACRVQREARPVCVHPIASMWHELGREIYEYFDSIDRRWTTIDPVHFAEAGKEPGPLYL